MNAAAKESVNIFDKLFARARLSEKDQAKLQSGQRQLYQYVAAPSVGVVFCGIAHLVKGARRSGAETVTQLPCP